MTASPLDTALDAVTGPRPTTQPAIEEVTRSATLTLVRVNVADLVPDPNNLRDEIADVQDLAASIGQVGLLQPLITRRTVEGTLMVVCGHRRLAALKVLGWPTVDVVVRRDMPPDQVLVAMLTENGQRVQLDPIEEARALNRLAVIDRLTHLDLAERVGRSQSYVSGRIALLSLSPQAQEEVRAGQQGLTHAIAQGRILSGRVRRRAKGAGWHLSNTHTLAQKARARCNKLEHRRGTRLGGVACGRCWESVIRADEKAALHADSARRGECAICGQPSHGIRVTPGTDTLTEAARP